VRVRLRHLPEQARFYAAPEREAAFVGGLGYGKTRTTCDWLLTGAAEYPKARHFIFSNTYSQLIAGTLRSFFEVCDYWGLTYVDRVHTYKEIRLPQLGATIEVRSVDKPINWKSLEFSRAWIDEAQAYKPSAYQMIVGRLRGSDTQRRLYPDMQSFLRITANPPHTKSHWLARACTVPNEKTGVPPIALYTASTYDNPFLPQDYIDSLERSYDEDLREIELGGKFGTLGTGKIWRMFDRGKHVLTPAQAEARRLPPLEYDDTQSLCISCDFNIDPLSWVLFQWREVQSDGYQRKVMYVLDELRIRHSMIEHGVKEFLNREDAARIAMRNGIILYGDPAGRQGNRQTGVSDWAALKSGLEQHGFRGESRVPKAPPAIRDRYNAGNRMLVNAKGEIGVIMHSRCHYLALDLEAMEYKPGTTVVDERQKLEDGATVTHHGDAWSYPIAEEFPVVRKPQPPTTHVM
jgi:hypothetical protein